MLLILPADFFDHGEVLCPSVYFFNRTCFGCGSTRAVMHMLHFDFRKAWEFNKLSVVVVPFLTYMYFSLIVKFVRRARGIPKKS
ncbi:MAG: DUF2752 domain-containing protein [Bacteroidetes bacterium]|nr:DUF2752 domain-containing protein [Bacteroidota bacterium]